MSHLALEDIQKAIQICGELYGFNSLIAFGRVVERMNLIPEQKTGGQDQRQTKEEVEVEVEEYNVTATTVADVADTVNEKKRKQKQNQNQNQNQNNKKKKQKCIKPLTLIVGKNIPKAVPKYGYFSRSELEQLRKSPSSDTKIKKSKTIVQEEEMEEEEMEEEEEEEEEESNDSDSDDSDDSDSDSDSDDSSSSESDIGEKKEDMPVKETSLQPQQNKDSVILDGILYKITCRTHAVTGAQDICYVSSVFPHLVYMKDESGGKLHEIGVFDKNAENKKYIFFRSHEHKIKILQQINHIK